MTSQHWCCAIAMVTGEPACSWVCVGSSSSPQVHTHTHTPFIGQFDRVIKVGVACLSFLAFLLAYAVFGGCYHCSQVGGQEDEQQGGGAKPPAEGGAGLYLGELRVMMRRLLQDEDIHNTVRWYTVYMIHVSIDH